MSTREELIHALEEHQRRTSFRRSLGAVAMLVFAVVAGLGIAIALGMWPDIERMLK